MFDIAPIQHIPFWFLIISIFASITLSPLTVYAIEKLIKIIGRIINKEYVKHTLYLIFAFGFLLAFFGLYSMYYSSQTTYQKYFLDDYDKNKNEIEKTITNYESVKAKIIKTNLTDFGYMDSLKHSAITLISRIDSLEIKLDNIQAKKTNLLNSKTNDHFSNELFIDTLISLIIAGLFFLLGIIVQLERKYKIRNSIK
jgi:hypothetical protein